MQITLNQTQIEEAIRQHVSARLNLSEGERLDLDLRATRGPEGYTCVVTITGDSEPTAPQPLKITDTVAAARTPEPEAEATEGQDNSQDNSQDEAESEEEVSREAASIEAGEAEQTETAEEAPSTRKKSIFAGLEKPINAPRQPVETPSAENETA